MRNDTIVTTFETSASTRANAVVPQNEQAPAVIEEEPDNDDDIPDLMDDPQVPTYDQKKARRVLQQVDTPWIRILGDYQMPLVHNVPTEEDFPPVEDFPNRGIQASSNPQ